MLSCTIMTGRLTHDPELRYTASNVPVTTIRIAVARDYVKEGDTSVDFFDVTAWRSTAEFVSKYFAKGKMITVMGRMQNREWTDKDENKRVSTELIADQVYFGDSKPKEEGTGSEAAASTEPEPPISPFPSGNVTSIPSSPFDGAPATPWDN